MGKNILSSKIFGPKDFKSKKNLVQKNLGQTNFDIKNFVIKKFVQKMWFTKIKAPKSLVKIGSVAAEILLIWRSKKLLIWTTVARAYVA